MTPEQQAEFDKQQIMLQNTVFEEPQTMGDPAVVDPTTIDPNAAAAPEVVDPNAVDPNAQVVDPAAAQQQQADPDPKAEAIAKLAEAQAEIEKLKAMLPDDNDKRVIEIARGGKESWERYMELQNMDYSAFSPLEKLEMQYLEQKAKSGKSYEELMEAFHQRMAHEFRNYDPNEDNRGLNKGELDILGERAEPWSTQKEQERQSMLLKFGAKPDEEQETGWSNDDHKNYTKKVADYVHSTKSIWVTDADGNSYEIPVTEDLANDFVSNGPSKWVEKNLLAEDDQKRLFTNPETTLRLAAIDKGLPQLLSDMRKQVEEKVRGELEQKADADRRSLVENKLGISGAQENQEPVFQNTAERLAYQIQQRQKH